jgi:hypothetical protein
VCRGLSPVMIFTLGTLVGIISWRGRMQCRT